VAASNFVVPLKEAAKRYEYFPDNSL